MAIGAGKSMELCGTYTVSVSNTELFHLCFNKVEHERDLSKIGQVLKLFFFVCFLS